MDKVRLFVALLLREHPAVTCGAPKPFASQIQSLGDADALPLHSSFNFTDFQGIIHASLSHECA